MAETKSLVRRVMIILAASAAALTVAACNTMEGAGRDVESAGEAVQDAAD
jgi:predicted small secreted protein